MAAESSTEGLTWSKFSPGVVLFAALPHFVTSCGDSIEVLARLKDDAPPFVAMDVKGDEVIMVACSSKIELSIPGHGPLRLTLDPAIGTVRFVHMTSDQRECYFTMSESVYVRCCSIDSKSVRIVDGLPSVPTALAVSPNSTWVVYASDQGPVVKLKDSKLGVEFTPRATTAPISLAVFHAENDDIFLLGFADGTVSVHSASGISELCGAGSDGGRGDLGRSRSSISKQSGDLHRALRKISAAAFFPTYKCRVAAGSQDGKIRIIDFEQGVALIRSIHVPAECTSLAILHHPVADPTEDSSDVSCEHKQDAIEDKPSVTIDGETSSFAHSPFQLPYVSFIAVGRSDGSISVFDALGLLQDEIESLYADGPVVQVVWGLKKTTTPLQSEDPNHFLSEAAEYTNQVTWAFSPSVIRRLRPVADRQEGFTSATVQEGDPNALPEKSKNIALEDDRAATTETQPQRQSANDEAWADEISSEAAEDSNPRPPRRPSTRRPYQSRAHLPHAAAFPPDIDSGSLLDGIFRFSPQDAPIKYPADIADIDECRPSLEIRNQLSLVCSEIASLRKAMWVLGSRLDHSGFERVVAQWESDRGQ